MTHIIFLFYFLFIVPDSRKQHIEPSVYNLVQKKLGLRSDLARVWNGSATSRFKNALLAVMSSTCPL